MAFDTVMAVRAVHVIAAVLWVGGGFFMAFLIGPNLRVIGPAAGPLMISIMRRGGFGPFFGVLGGVTVLSGAYAYWKMGFAEVPFEGTSNMLLTVGVIVALLAWLHGIAALMPNELRIKKLVKEIPMGSPPTPEQGKRLQELGMKQGRLTLSSIILLLAALVLMTGHAVFA